MQYFEYDNGIPARWDYPTYFPEIFSRGEWVPFPRGLDSFVRGATPITEEECNALVDSTLKMFGGDSLVQKFNPHHDKLGRFTTAGRVEYSGEAYGEKVNENIKGMSKDEIIRAAVESVLTEEEQELYYSITNKMKQDSRSSPDTKTKYARIGRNGRAYYDGERGEIHKQILDELFSDYARFLPERNKKPTFILLGGRGGSGKSSFEASDKPESVGVYDKGKSMVIDADYFKNKLAQKEGLKGAGHFAARYHEESGDMVFAALQRARDLGINVVLDATLKSPGDRYLDRFAAAGYRTEVHFMELPKIESCRRALLRWKNGKDGPFTGRLVPLDVILSNNKNERNYDRLKRKASAWSFWDNNVRKGEPPIMVEGDTRRVRAKKEEGEIFSRLFVTFPHIK